MSSSNNDNIGKGTSSYVVPRKGSGNSRSVADDSDRAKMPPPPSPKPYRLKGSRMSIAVARNQTCSENPTPSCSPVFDFINDWSPTWSRKKTGKANSKPAAVASSSGTKGRKSKAPPIQPEPKSEVVSSEKLQSLVKSVDPHAELGKEVEDVLGDYADLFLTQILEGASQLAKHRGSTKMEMEDVAIYLERNQNLEVSKGANGDTTVKQMNNKMAQDSHRQRIGLINKTIYKY